MNEMTTYKLGDIARFVNGRAYLMPEMLSQGKYRIVRVGNFTGKDEWYYSDMELEPDKYCESGDLLYKWACTFGPEIWTEEKAIYHYHIWKVICSELINKQFLYDTTDDYIIYSSPILLNDEETNLRIRQTYDGAITVEGAWDGIGNNGISSRNIVKIGTGDTIIPVYYSYDWDDEEDVYYGEEYDVEGKLRVDYSLLLEGEYLYSFCIDDIYGDYYMTDPVAFYVDADGEVMFGY